MKQNDDFMYDVATGEEITLVFKPFGIRPELITAALSGKPIDPDPPRPNPTYTFTANRPVGKSHFFKVECDFVGGTPKDRVDVEVSGEADGVKSGPFKFTIAKKDAIHDPEISFKVVK